jgi:phage terminase large subunit GpA-like protein
MATDPTKPIEPWMLDGEQELSRFVASQCAPPSTDPMWKWCEHNIILDGTGPFPGRYRTEFTPMVRWVYDKAQNPKTKRITVMVSAQSAKTQLGMNILNWCINEDPGPTMWTMAQSDHMSEFVQKRLLPSVENCEQTAKRLVESKKGLIVFDSMNLMLRGSNSRAKLQSDPVRRLFCDERREWAPGAIDLLRKRTRTFHNFLELSFGTAGRKDDELHCDFKEGCQTIAHFNCKACGHSQPFRFGRNPTSVFVKARDRGGVVWEVNETTRPNGVWNYEAVAKTVRYECEQCGYKHVTADKVDMLKTIHPVDYNPTAPQEFQSFHWNALAMLWESCSFENLALEFLKATEAAKNRDNPNLEPLKAFVTETLGEPWEDLLGVIEDFGFLEDRRSDYSYGDAWAEEVTRFMSADKQEKGGEHYWYVVRSFGRGGKSRLFSYGRCNSFAELEETRKQYGVKIQNAMIDSGFKASLVYRFCAGTGWKAFKGDDAEHYLHRVHDPKNPLIQRIVRRIWSKSDVDPLFGTLKAGRVKHIPLFRFSNPSTKDLLANYTMGIVGDWTLPHHVSKEYLKQLSAEARIERTDARGRIQFQWHQLRPDNHLLDCELMILVAAVINGLVVLPDQAHIQAE